MDMRDEHGDEPGAPKLLTAGAQAMGVSLNDAQICKFKRYYAEIVRWNRRVNLTAITDWEATQTLHFLDSLSAAAGIPAKTLKSGTFVDIGSGAGFPGIPLSLAYPGMCGTLVDATAKKTAFLTHICRVLGLHNIWVCTGRAETLAHDGELRERFDVALARAVADVAALSELTLPFVRIGGVVVMQKSMNIQGELDRAHAAIETLGGRLRCLMPVPAPYLREARALVVVEKVRETPQRFPRRPGMPAKRPLA